MTVIERLLKHPCSYKSAEFISMYQKPMISTRAINESSPVIITILHIILYILCSEFLYYNDCLYKLLLV